MDNYGLTAQEQKTNFYKYNHALFRNMKSFMDCSWEINLLTENVVLLHETMFPRLMKSKQDYGEIIQLVTERLVYHTDREAFLQKMSVENLKKLKKEEIFEIHMLGEQGIPETYRLILTPVPEKEETQCVYLSAKNIELDIHRMHKMETEKHAIYSAMGTTYPCILYSNLTRNTCDAYMREGMDLGIPLSGSYDNAFRIFARNISEEYQKEFKEKYNRNDLTRRLLYSKEQIQSVDMEAKQIYPEGEHWISIKAVQVSDTISTDLIVVIMLSVIDVQKENERLSNLMLQRSNESLRRSLSREEQYRQAIISGAVLVYNVNVTRNQIEDEIFEIVEEKKIPLLRSLGMQAPCSFDEFVQKWAEVNVAEEDREAFVRDYNHKSLLEAYQRGKIELEYEFRRISDDGWSILRRTILLIQNEESGEIIALCNAKDITKQREQEYETQIALREAYEAAKRANQAKSDFLSRMSHDIRTPMNAVIGMTALARAHLDDRERLEECLSKISSSSSHLLEIINKVLDMSKIESGTIDLNEEEFDLNELIDQLLQMSEEGIHRKNHKLVVKIDHVEHEKVIGDSARIQQVFMNLMSNAIKYTPNGGTICFTVRENPSKFSTMAYYEFIFEDTGIGMSKEFQKRIFEPFVREEDSRTSKIQGSGLGMAITKSLISMMNGDIWLESEVNKGSKFTIGLHLKIQDKEYNPLNESIQLQTEENPLDCMKAQDFSDKRVLLVEDNELNTEIALEMLKMTGVAVENAENGEEAVKKFLNAPIGYYDLIFMDVQMPIMNGYEATKKIRNLERSDAKTIPIIAMTANAFAEDIADAKRAGMNAHFAKPIDGRRLIGVMKQWLNLS